MPCEFHQEAFIVVIRDETGRVHRVKVNGTQSVRFYEDGRIDSPQIGNPQDGDFTLRDCMVLEMTK